MIARAELAFDGCLKSLRFAKALYHKAYSTGIDDPLRLQKIIVFPLKSAK